MFCLQFVRETHCGEVPKRLALTYIQRVLAMGAVTVGVCRLLPELHRHTQRNERMDMDGEALQ